MKKSLYLLFSILLFSSAVSAQTLHIENPIRFLALGDSYTIGQSVPPNERWPVQLSDSLVERGFTIDTLTIIATTGWRTDNLINAIRNKNLEDKNYNLVSLLIGVNNQYQNRPFNQYVTEFPALLDSAIRYAGGDKRNVFIVSIPDYAYTPFGQQSSNPGEISAELYQYNAFAKHIADSLDITFFDITPISRLGLQFPSYVANDGLHPSGIQYTEWVKLILAVIDAQITAVENPRTISTLKVHLSPNPVNDYLHIEIPVEDFQTQNQISIYHITGQLMFEEKISQQSPNISTTDFPPGLYVVRIQMGNQYAVLKFLKTD